MKRDWFMKRSLIFCVALGVAFFSSLAGCSDRKTNDAETIEKEEKTVKRIESAEDASLATTPEVDNSPLEVDNPEAPEGVVNLFFKTFFSGDDDGAFALLTSRAQMVKRDRFLAQESSTVRWRITKKMKPIRGRVLVLVEVEDYTDSGSIQMDELTFVLTNDDLEWRIAGFSVGDLAVNFEGVKQEAYALENNEEPTKTARMLDGDSIVR